MADPSAIEIRIETLEVEGAGPAGEPRFRRDVERELARLVTEGGSSWGAPEPRVLISTTMPDRTPGQDSLAQRVAAAIYQALTT